MVVAVKVIRLFVGKFVLQFTPAFGMVLTQQPRLLPTTVKVQGPAELRTVRRYYLSTLGPFSCFCFRVVSIQGVSNCCTNVFLATKGFKESFFLIMLVISSDNTIIKSAKIHGARK